MACNPFYVLNIPRSDWESEDLNPGAEKGSTVCGMTYNELLDFQGTRWMCFRTWETFGCDNGEPHKKDSDGNWTFEKGWCPPGSSKICPKLNTSRRGPSVCIDLVESGLASEEEAAAMFKWWQEWVESGYDRTSDAQLNFDKFINDMVCTDGKFDQDKIEGALSKTPKWKELEGKGIKLLQALGFCDCDNPNRPGIQHTLLNFNINNNLTLEKIGQGLDKQHFMRDYRDSGGIS
tara:strand:- start:1317 stop:2018 length:702 start_codon:yes stop_codon:yes gene_type:complete